MKTFYTDGTEKPHEIKNPSGATIVALELHEKVLRERAEKEGWHLFLCNEQCKRCGQDPEHPCINNNIVPCPEFVHKNDRDLS